MTAAITNVRIFDGEDVLGERSVVIDHGLIRQVGGPLPPGAEVVDGAGDVSCPA